MINGCLDIFHGFGKKGLIKKILLICPYPDILPVKHIGFVQFSKKIRRHFHGKNMEIIHTHVFHQSEMLFVTVVVSGRLTLQGGFIGQIGGIPDPLKKQRRLSFNIDNL